jgi:hypothetical protein
VSAVFGGVPIIRKGIARENAALLISISAFGTTPLLWSVTTPVNLPEDVVRHTAATMATNVKRGS